MEAINWIIGVGFWQLMWLAFKLIAAYYAAKVVFAIIVGLPLLWLTRGFDVPLVKEDIIARGVRDGIDQSRLTR